MSISVYSIFMSIACSSVIFFTAGFLVSHANKVRWGLILLIMLLGFARLILPIDFPSAKIIVDRQTIPYLQKFLLDNRVGELSIAEILLLIWGVGVFFQFLYLAVGIRRIREIREHSIPVIEGDWLYQLQKQVIEELGYSGKCQLAVTKELYTAVSVGFFQPMILIPIEMLDFTELEVKGVLKHELTHYLRGDVGKLRLLFVVQCLFWWNPVLYYLRACVERMLELECDEHACAGMDEEERKAYLKAITKVLRAELPKAPKFGLGLRKNLPSIFLERRFEEVLHPVKKQPDIVTYPLAVVCLAIFCVSYSFIVQPGFMPEEEQISLDKSYEDTESVSDFLIKLPSGNYQYVSNLLVIKELKESEIHQEPYADLPVYYNTGKGE